MFMINTCKLHKIIADNFLIFSNFKKIKVTYPLCTIATTPRLPEHCIEYVKLLQWPKENPFNVPIDGDDPSHLNWICEKAVDRASQFGKSFH